MAEDKKALKLKRRGAKARFTRHSNGLQMLLDNNRVKPEVQSAFDKVEQAFEALQEVHENFTLTLDDDAEFETEEQWMNDCQKEFMELKITVTDYCSQTSPDVKTPAEQVSQSEMTPVEREASSPQESTSAPPPPDQSPDTSPSMAAARCSFKVEKPKLPKFAGDVRDYEIFKSDFIHMVDSQYGKRDAMTILRSCLVGRAHDVIQGIGSDYDAAWELLDSMYGDPRIVADTIINDLTKFRPLKENEDNRFCELVNLVRRSYNILKLVGKKSDMDNSHMLATIERKMCPSDRKNWFRYQETEKQTAGLQTLLTWLNLEMKARMRSSAPLRSQSEGRSAHVNQMSMKEKNKPAYSDRRHEDQPPDRFQRQNRCWYCKTDEHWIDQCKRLTSMGAPERLKFLKENRCCFSCLKKAGKNHYMANCRRRQRCPEQGCTYYHHPLLHMELGHQSENESSKNNVNVATTVGASLLPILTVDIASDFQTRTNVLLDSGSQVSLIKNSLAEKLHLTGTRTRITIKKLGEVEEELETFKYKVPIREANTSKKPQFIEVVGVPSITEEEAVSVKDLADQFDIPNLNRDSGPVEVLIGVDYPRYIVGGKLKKRKNCIARKTPLGWVIFGGTNKRTIRVNVLHVSVQNPDLSEFWRLESQGVGCQCQETTKLTKQEQIEEEIIRASSQNIGKKWEIAYPWQRDPHELPDNKSQAVKILESTEKRLARNPVHAEAYNKQIHELEEMGFAKKLTAADIKNYEGPVHYISHHAIVRPEKKSTPIRIVFNSSASFQGHRLNEYWMKGPDLLNNLIGVLLRFRENEVALCGDISKMYHRVSIPERDQHVHRFLWRDMDEHREPDIYMMKVVTFGDKPAAAMAQTALKLTAEQGESTHPQAASVLTRNVYMDDICDSVRTVDEARKLSAEMDEVLNEGGFKVKGWISNESDVGDLTQGKMKLLDEIAEEKVLGVVWNRENDTFSYKVKLKDSVMRSATDGESQEKLTKRKILGQIAHIFDPIGFAAPVIVRAKIGMQKLWQRGYNWDDHLSKEEDAEWRLLFEEMKGLNEVSLERCLTPPDAQGKPVLCIFSDASENAYGACAYLRWQTRDDKYETRFIASKSKVAPLKALTIPRLELQAAVLAARLYKSITEEMRLEVEKVVFFTDSMITLQWIKSSARVYKPFVSSRVGEIQTLTDPSSWKHIPGEDNPADKVSRGIAVKELMEEWMCGPNFLHLNEPEWPVDKATIDQNLENLERRKTQTVLVINMTVNPIECERFSKWRKLVRVTAYVFRFVQILKSKLMKVSIPEDDVTLTPAELEKAEHYWTKEAQKGLKSRFEKGEFKTLTPFLDNKGIIRVGGRVENLVTSYESKHPALLPASHHIALLITRHVHEIGHPGVETTTAKTRRKFWILQGHRLAKTVKHRCVKCRSAECKRETQKMADLPSSRLAPHTPPFYYTSCDYFGPFQVKVGRNKRAKHYGVIFTCLNTRAVHLEIATDCSTMEFLQVLRRFFAVRGQPAQILSDNGTQFVGAQRELREMIAGWSEDELKDFCAEKRVQWKFITPGAPHQNGCAESLVKSAKIAIKKAIGEQVLTPFELLTCFLEVANLMNERPIGRKCNDPDDGSYLSPNDILLGRSSRNVPQGPFKQTKNPRHRVEFIQQIVDSFWKQWSQNVLPLLVPCRKWNADRRNVRVGDVVMTADSNAVRGKWTIARIIQVYPGPDGKVRNVKLKTVSGEYRRPISKLAVIYPAEGYID